MKPYAQLAILIIIAAVFVTLHEMLSHTWCPMLGLILASLVIALIPAYLLFRAADREDVPNWKRLLLGTLGVSAFILTWNVCWAFSEEGLIHYCIATYGPDDTLWRHFYPGDSGSGYADGLDRPIGKWVDMLETVAVGTLFLGVPFGIGSQYMPRKALTHSATLAACVGLSLAAGYWATGPFWKDLRAHREAGSFRDRLVAGIEGADRIDVVEYSGKLDFLDGNGLPDETHPRVEYARMTLDAIQRQKLATLVRGVEAKPKESFTLCIFDPHHSFEFSQHGASTQMLDVCFHSQYLAWHKPGDPWVEYQTAEPEGLIKALATFVKGCGLRVGVDWQAIAKPNASGQMPVAPSGKNR